MAVGWSLFTLILALWVGGCDRNQQSVRPPGASTPTVRIYALGGVAGALEPCGCVQDMLGGVDHAAAFLSKQKSKAPHALLLGAGSLFFADPHPPTVDLAQVKFKADTLALAMRDLGLHAWAPGANDLALGRDEFTRLREKAGAAALAANVTELDQEARGRRIFEQNGWKIGVVGLASLASPVGKPKSVPIAEDYEEILRQELTLLKRDGAHILVALLALPRGESLRLIERVSGYHLAILGKPFDAGEHNDTPFPPERIGDCLVVQAPNHLQGLGVVDLYLTRGDTQLDDGSGLSYLEQKQKLDTQIEELERRLVQWRSAEFSISKADLRGREEQLKELVAARDRLKAPPPPEKGSYFQYDLVLVRETHGSDPRLGARLEAYYKQVNDFNRELFKDKRPMPVEDGQASYLGAASCQNCHMEAYDFWKKTPHAHAYATLVKDHKEFNLDCVGCHVTGYERPGGTTVTHVENLTDVQCEVCHGPGSAHLKNPAEKALIRGVPERSLCAESCHHPPHVGAEWQVDIAWAKILGPGHGRPRQ